MSEGKNVQLSIGERAAAIEADTVGYPIAFHRANPYTYLGDEAKAAGNSQMAKEMYWEAQAFALTVSPQADQRRRFRPLMSAPQPDGTERTYPDLDKDFSPEALSYYEKRLAETTNPLYRARYADILWDFKYGKRAGVYALKAAEAYFECAEIYRALRWGGALVDALSRVVNLAASINNAGLLERAKGRVFEHVRALDAEQDYRYTIEPLQVLIGSKRVALTDAEADELQGILSHAAKYYGGEVPERERDREPMGPAGRDLYMQREMYKLLINLSRKQKDDALALRWQKAEVYSVELEADSAHPMAAFDLYRYAASAYADLGMTDDLDRIKLKLKQNAAAAGAQMTQHQVPIPISGDEFEQIIAPALSGTLEDGLMNLAHNWVQRVSDVERAADEASEKYIFASLVNKLHLRDNNVVSAPRTEEQIRRERFVEQYSLTRGFISLCVSTVLDRLVERFGLDADKLVAFFQESIIDGEKLPLLRVGFERFFARDYVSAIHVLTPHLEDVLRRLVAKVNEPTTAMRAGATTQEISIDKVLEVLGQQSGFQPDLIEYYRIFLTEQSADNLRNRVGHGLVSFEECTDTRAATIIHLLLILKRFKLSSAAPVRPDNASNTVTTAGPLGPAESAVTPDR